jgi:hypothetical protein
MRFDTKFVVIVREDLALWQKLNVTAFLAGGLAGTQPELIGEPYLDASGTIYSPLVRQPILVFAATTDELTKAHQRGLERQVTLAIYTSELFATGHDEANRAAVAAVPRDGLDLVGLAFHADKRLADKITKGLKLHP